MLYLRCLLLLLLPLVLAVPMPRPKESKAEQKAAVAAWHNQPADISCKESNGSSHMELVKPGQGCNTGETKNPTPHPAKTKTSILNSWKPKGASLKGGIKGLLRGI